MKNGATNKSYSKKDLKVVGVVLTAHRRHQVIALDKVVRLGWVRIGLKLDVQDFFSWRREKRRNSIKSVII